jgi:molybdenum-dependent DNA-binding transcriptional regulator ModE
LERTALTNEELRRVEILSRVSAAVLSLKSSAEMMGVSYRQAKRLWRRFRACGGPGLKHGNAGKRSNRAKSAALRRKVLRQIRKKYSGTEEERFGPTLAAEHLASEDGLEVDAETLRRWMLEDGLWTRQRKSQAETKRAQRALRRTGANGWKLSPLAGEAWTRGMPDEFGG